MREQLKPLVPAAPDAPEYETQDPLLEEVSEMSEMSETSESDEDRVVVTLSLEEMRLGDMVEVFWKGENKWFEGEITDVCLEDKTFQVIYQVDSECLWHSVDDYPCRQSC